MQNLAGHARSTEIITDELTRCGIEVVESDKALGEPKSMVKGKLGKFEFQRAWYYYMVDGNVPLAVAEELYATKVGRSDIRVAGHCGCPEPKEWAKSFAEDGKEFISEKQRDELMEFFTETGLKCYKPPEAALKESLERMNWVVGNKEDGQLCVDSYHIDSELGLYLFVEALKKHKLV